MKPALEVRRLGVVRYADGLELQQRLVDRRRAGEIPDQLLLLQHPHVLTVGVKKDSGRSNIIATSDRLRALGVEVHETGRGGDVTYHGPGQIVGYPIFDLRPDRCDVHRYVRDLEEVMIRVAADFDVEARRVPGLTGVWVRQGGQVGQVRQVGQVGRVGQVGQVGEVDKEERVGQVAKIGAIGVRISRWITSHGFAFNVNVDLDYFTLIVPCGIQDRDVTSLQRLIGRSLSLESVEDSFVRHFAQVFDRQALEAACAVEAAIESGQ